jgi:hypothetical protein
MEAIELLNESFRNVGREYGYDSVTAEFFDFKEFKIKWRRSCGWAEFDVSDYVLDAPKDVMEGLAETIFSRILRKPRKEYPKPMLDWITSDEFLRTKQPLYVARARDIKRTAVGDHVNLYESYIRLSDMGLVNFDEDMVITWTKYPFTKRLGHCSVLMKVVMISSFLDSPDVPTCVSDYALYHELIHISKGFDPFGQRHGVEFHVLEHLYPMRDEAEAWLKTRGLKL